MRGPGGKTIRRSPLTWWQRRLRRQASLCRPYRGDRMEKGSAGTAGGEAWNERAGRVFVLTAALRFQLSCSANAVTPRALRASTVVLAVLAEASLDVFALKMERL
ncbi:unnamed protein product [Prorocentrum cordatum]|uniref:Uncharacterized protein n=1 Tax=Prorocentrum cordatum TaxID=2364126 RepID=A0ABN9TP86_9DINO|nr:unnamed protein product [Polarella glacialis]